MRDPAQRKAIYGQARNALIRQLAEAQPRMPNADIAERVVEFDRAMQRIESELAVELVDEPAAEPSAAEAGGAGDAGPANDEDDGNGWDPALAESDPELPPRSPDEWDESHGQSGAVALREPGSPTLYADH